MPHGLGLGRLPAPDERDAAFPMRLAVPERTRKTSRYWAGNVVHLDQGEYPQCVEYGWTHFLVDSPTTHPVAPLRDLFHSTLAGLYQPARGVVHEDKDGAEAGSFYAIAQRMDEWPGEAYDGTSVRAGARAAQAMSLIGPYLWASDIDELCRCVLEQGPVVVGTEWLEEMFWPEHDPHFILNVSGSSAGGHCWKVDGVNLRTGLARMKNSWGVSWGRKSRAFIRLEDLDDLCFSSGGEAALALEPSVSRAAVLAGEIAR